MRQLSIIERFLLLSICSFLIPRIRSQSVTFQTEALSKKTTCDQLTRNDCLFYHEAVDKCGSVCDDRIKNGDKAQDNNKDNTDKGTKPKKKGCFHGDDVVITRQHGPAKLSEVAEMTDVELLSRDDHGRLAFSPVYYWIHKDATVTHRFIELRTKSGHRLSITADHLIYETTCDDRTSDEDSLRAVFADRLTIGQCLLVKDGHNRLVKTELVEKSARTKTGIYSPITRNGNLLVNDVLASSFVCLENEKLQKIMYHYMDRAMRVLKMLTPRSLVEMFYSTPADVQVAVPEVVFSFWDLGKKFVKY